VGSEHKLALWHRNRAFGSPRIASTAYQLWPTWSRTIRNQKNHLLPCLPLIGHLAKAAETLGLAHSQFEDRSGKVAFPEMPLIRCSTSQNFVRFFIFSHRDSGYPEGNFEGNQLLEGSMSLSPLCPTLTNDLHVSTDTGLHHSFPWLHRSQV